MNSVNLGGKNQGNQHSPGQSPVHSSPCVLSDEFRELYTKVGAVLLDLEENRLLSGYPVPACLLSTFSIKKLFYRSLLGNVFSKLVQKKSSVESSSLETQNLESSIQANSDSSTTINKTATKKTGESKDPTNDTTVKKTTLKETPLPSTPITEKITETSVTNTFPSDFKQYEDYQEFIRVSLSFVSHEILRSYYEDLSELATCHFCPSTEKKLGIYRQNIWSRMSLFRHYRKRSFLKVLDEELKRRSGYSLDGQCPILGI